MKQEDLFFKLIPLLTSFFILSGICYAFGYYRVFNLNIFLYLEFSEILLLFLNDLLITGLPFLMTLAMAWPLLKSPKLALVTRKQIIIISLIFILIMGLWYLIGGSKFIVYILMLVVMTVFVFVISFFRLIKRTHFAIYGLTIRKSYFLLLMALGMYLILALLNGINSGIRKLHEDNASPYAIALNDNSTILVNDTLIHIGGSRNYTFFYHRNSREKTIISNKEISFVRIK